MKSARRAQRLREKEQRVLPHLLWGRLLFDAVLWSEAAPVHPAGILPAAPRQAIF